MSVRVSAEGLRRFASLAGMLYGISGTLSEIEQRDSAQHDSEQRGLRADLPLAEHQRTRDERDDDARAPDRRNDRQQGLRIAQRVKVEKIGRCQQHGAQKDRPSPAERGRALARGVPHGHDDGDHHQRLVVARVCLNGESVVAGDQELIP